LQGADSDVKVFSFTTGDANYDELPWVRRMLAQTRHPLFESRLTAEEVPDLAVAVQAHQDEPFGGLPTLAYAKLFELARREGVIVLLDGQGMDEQWAGYDYYRNALDGASPPLVQGSRDSAVRPSCLTPEFRDQARPFVPGTLFSDPLRNLQYRDAFQSKIPRALRFNDRISMRSSTELREPFLDHRLFELAFRQPQSRKIDGNRGKLLLRRIAANSLPTRITDAPKRPMQTPQREWLRGPLRHWSESMLEAALEEFSGSWLDGRAVRKEWSRFCNGEFDNSFFIWQWISLGLSTNVSRTLRVP
jgi:asparagine synthase (glutamine-hydrolysing)